MHAATHVVSLSWRETLWRGVASRRARPRCVRPAREPRLVPPLPRCLLSALHGGVTGLRVCLLYVLTGSVAHGPSATPDARRRPTPSRDRGSDRGSTHVSRRVGSRTARAWGLLTARTVPRARSASRGHSPTRVHLASRPAVPTRCAASVRRSLLLHFGEYVFKRCPTYLQVTEPASPWQGTRSAPHLSGRFRILTCPTSQHRVFSLRM